LAFDKAGNLFVTAYRNGSLYKFTPNGVGSSFGYGLENPIGIACDGAGNVFVADLGGGGGADGSIYKFAPDGTRTTFATGLDTIGLAFDEAGNLYAAEYDGATSNIIYKFTPDGARSIFATGVNGNGMFFLAYEVPEPSVAAMVGMAGLLLIDLRRKLGGAIS
jgi:serine/threonine-protein kinase